MKILIIGDYPGFFGGVTNYTRPLAEELAKSNKVYYLYTCTRTLNYDFLGMRIKKSNPIANSNVEYFELLNPPTRYLNYDNLNLDHGHWGDKIISSFLEKTKPSVIHIHEIFGLSSNIISLAKKNNIKVIVTVHEYWWLCPHRVMVDFNKRICEGPKDINKCTHCVVKQMYVRQSKLRMVIRRNFKWFHSFYVKFVKTSKLSNENAKNATLNFGTERPLKHEKTKLYSKIDERLKANISKLNQCDLIIGVSNDVKFILSNYGVQPDKIKVNHIGSTIAEFKIKHTKVIDPKKIVFGFIGGVGYYKGVHQLIRAFLNLSNEEKHKAEIRIYGKYDEAYYAEMNKEIDNDPIAKERIIFFGKYTPNELTVITNSIDISVLPSLCADTAPQTIFESFSADLPIIAPRIGGFPDFVIHNVNGLIYDEASVEDLSKQLELIIRKPDLLEAYRKNIPETKTMAMNVAELLEIYKI